MKKKLVLIQLAGGNDALNTVIPLEVYDQYQSARGVLSIPELKVLPLNGRVGFHPAMDSMRIMYNEGWLGIIQNVGMPNPDFSHFRASDIWATASRSDEYLTTGWLGRALELSPAGNHPRGIRIGSVPSLAFQGTVGSPAITIQNDSSFYDFTETDLTGSERLQHVKRIRRQTEQYTAEVAKAAQLVKQQLNYPDTSLAAQLKIVARLIAGGLSTQVYMVTMNGFDTHADQVNASDPTTGHHANLLKTVSEAIAAFMADLFFLGSADDVVGMTYSEFGRSVKANGSLGTDHGHAAPVFYFGAGIQSNTIYGTTPDLSGDVLPMQYDFRDVYASMLEYIGTVPEKVIAGGFYGLDDLFKPEIIMPEEGIIEVKGIIKPGRYKLQQI